MENTVSVERKTPCVIRLSEIIDSDLYTPGQVFVADDGGDDVAWMLVACDSDRGLRLGILTLNYGTVNAREHGTREVRPLPRGETVTVTGGRP